MNADTKRIGGLMAAAAVMVGSLMPWATVATVFGSVDVAGTEGDGVITLIGAVVVGLAVLIRRYVSAAIGFAVVAAISIYHVSNVAQMADEADSEFVRASVGWGLWVLVVGSVVGVLVSLVRPEAAPTPIAAGRPSARVSGLAPGSPLPPPRTK